MNEAQKEILDQLHQLIPQLSESQLVHLFEDDMVFDGYLSNNRRPDNELWSNARDWLKDYLERTDPSVEKLEDMLSDMECEIDYPDS